MSRVACSILLQCDGERPLRELADASPCLADRTTLLAEVAELRANRLVLLLPAAAARRRRRASAVSPPLEVLPCEHSLLAAQDSSGRISVTG